MVPVSASSTYSATPRQWATNANSVNTVEMDDPDALLSIQISDTEADDQKRARRTGQTEEAFRAVQRDYRAKVENGHIYKTLALPLRPGANKQHVQEVVHAVEELYFFRRYRDALRFVATVLADGSAEALDSDTRSLLLVYETRCQQKLTDSS